MGEAGDGEEAVENIDRSQFDPTEREIRLRPYRSDYVAVGLRNTE
jgi:hypothetical protein